MKKRTTSLLLVLVMVFSMIPVTATANEHGNGLQYEVYDDHVVITGYTGIAAEVVIPEEIEGLPVTSIGDAAFYSCTSLTTIKIPHSVISIDNYAFIYCSSLVQISVDENNPNYSNDDRGVLFDKEKTCLIAAPGAIVGTYTIPNSVTSIGINAFLSCTSLTNIEIPEGVTSIGDSAFSECSSLTSIKIPEGITSIGDWTFSDCTSLTSIDLPNSLASIGYGAFSRCATLTGIEIPEGVTSIGDWAFQDCSSLTSMEIPESVTSIGYAAFTLCTSLTGIHVDRNNPYYSSDNYGVLFDKDKTLLIRAPGEISGSYEIPNSVTSIDDYAFFPCTSLASITIPEGVTSIGYAAFAECTSLTDIEIPEGVAYIGDFCFSSCTKLTSIRFSGDAPAFGEKVFIVVTATAYYPAGNPTWTADVMQNYGGDITWVPYNPANPFTDVPAGSFYEQPVLWALENGITNGTSDTAFSPEDPCQRAHVVTFLHRAAKNPEPTVTDCFFTDVPEGSFFREPVLWAVEKGITNGISATAFGSYAICNRAAVVTFLWRAAGKPEPAIQDNPFTDVTESDYFYQAVLWAVENGITMGVDATHFGPATNCNRAQVVTFLYRAYN